VIYLLVAGAVLVVNVLPAFGPPTWSVLALVHLRTDANPVALVVLGAIAAAVGRTVLALATRRVRNRLSQERRANLAEAKTVLTGSRTRSLVGIGLFALSPVPSAQLFEAAGLLEVPLRPLVLAFFAGRVVSYSVYVSGASALKDTDAGDLVVDAFKSPWGIAVQVVLLAGVGALARVDWTRWLRRD
jgi:uncharacterized membrane protein YdjX (TVP38/TMEM64 family)